MQRQAESERAVHDKERLQEQELENGSADLLSQLAAGGAAVEQQKAADERTVQGSTTVVE